MPIWHASSPAVAPRSTCHAIRNDLRTSTGKRRAIVVVVICAPACSRDSSRYWNSSSCAAPPLSGGFPSASSVLGCAAVLPEVKSIPLSVGHGWFARLNDAAGISNTCFSVGPEVPG